MMPMECGIVRVGVHWAAQGRRILQRRQPDALGTSHIRRQLGQNPPRREKRCRVTLFADPHGERPCFPDHYDTVTVEYRLWL